MINFDDATKRNIKEHNLDFPQIPYLHPTSFNPIYS